MSAEDAVREMAELRTGASVLSEIGRIGNLAHAIDELYMLRNDSRGLVAEQAAQRRALTELMIRILRNRLRVAARERLIPLLEEWERIAE